MRILLAGTSSGCGKTTASLLLMAALRERGLDVAPCKVGPDYIDTGFHELVCGRPSHNLDSFLIEPRDLPTLLSRPADITVIEGVMGYYDGMDATSCRQSTWEMARLTRTPVLLVVDASGSAASAAATVKGFMTLREDSGIAGVLVNRVSGAHHYELVRDAVAHYTGLPCVGYIEKHVNLALKSRHLGLVPAEEVEDALPRIQEAARQVADTLDLPMILELASRGNIPGWTAFAWGLRVIRRSAFTTAPISMRWKGRAWSLCRFPRLRTANCRRGWTGCIWAADFRRYSRCGCRPICPCAKASARHWKAACPAMRSAAA